MVGGNIKKRKDVVKGAGKEMKKGRNSKELALSKNSLGEGVGEVDPQRRR